LSLFEEFGLMPRAFVFLVASCLGCSRGPEVPDMVNDQNPPQRPIRLSLEAAAKTVKVGEVPRFTLTIHNEGDGPQRVIDLRGGRRADLQDSYYELEVTRGGRAVDIPRAISDPGPLGEGDFLELKPGERVTFELTQFAAALGGLNPGAYQARVRFWQDPYQPWETAFFSPYAEFTVGE
jgi:hypothetical protein